jgi:N-acetylglucosamine-6-phosphate deacetylase
MKPVKTNKFLLAGQALLANGYLQDVSLHISEGKIAQIDDGFNPGADLVVQGTIVPGFVDLQINGGYGIDFTRQPDQADVVARRLPETGTTAFLPTIITSPFHSYPERINDLVSGLLPILETRVENNHLEGPYLNPLRQGAHPLELLRPIDVDELLHWANSKYVRLVTLAAELPGGDQAVRKLTQAGIITSLGHSDASFSQTQVSLKNGIRWATHLFNAMRPINHREPGLIPALLESDIPCGVIADGIHVHPAMLRLAFLLKGSHGLTLVTDAMAALGMPAGEYRLGEDVVIVGEKDARLQNGTLAGSLLRMDEAVRNMVAFSGCTLFEAVSMASSTPAKLLGLEGLMGKIASGYLADLVILDEHLQVTHTFIDGQLVYSKS